MFDKISRHLWIFTTCFFSAVITLTCFRIIQFHYYPVNFKFTVEEVTDYEIRPKQYTLDFYDKAKDKLGADYSSAISYAKGRVQNSIKEYKDGLVEEQRTRYVEGYKENNKPSEVLEVKVDTTTMVETHTYNCLLYTSPSPRD